ncbi:DUF1145 domain-containing protein [Pseudomonas cavernicola]|uniref:DUF1145 domain-containing protein n=1 Tax=Pseudomonas cavernicola TaxID=2320866 RepID=UPI002367EC44|nr:DUF1145 domain-containing protein [Pseudomonas cavernicola]
MNIGSFAKGAVAMFWLMAVLNLLFPFGRPLQGPISLIAGVMLLVHIAEVLLYNRRLAVRPLPWLERLQVLLFGVLHLRSLR